MNCDRDSAEFLMNCMKENLSHARHIEKEIHQGANFLIAVEGIVFSIVFSKTCDCNTCVILNVVLILMNIIVFFQTKRWYEVFDCYMKCAKKIYVRLHADKLGHQLCIYEKTLLDGISNNMKPLSDKEYAFCFDFYHKYHYGRTRIFIYLMQVLVCIPAIIKLFLTIIVL